MTSSTSVVPFRALLFGLLFLPVLARPGAAQDEETKSPGFGLGGILEFYPAGTLFSPELDGFAATDGNIREELSSFFSIMPSMRIGPSLETPIAFLDLTIGGGAIIAVGDVERESGVLETKSDANLDALVPPFVRGDFAARFKIGDFITLGPRIGIVHLFEPSWSGDLDVDLSDETAWTFGVGFTAGADDLLFALSIDYLHAVLDVDSINGRAPASFGADDELKLSGVAVQLGLICRF